MKIYKLNSAGNTLQNHYFDTLQMKRAVANFTFFLFTPYL